MTTTFSGVPPILTTGKSSNSIGTFDLMSDCAGVFTKTMSYRPCPVVEAVADGLNGVYGVGVGRKGVISGSGNGGSGFFSLVSKEKIVGSGGVSSASIFSGSEASSGSGSSSSFGSCSSSGSAGFGVAVSPALAPPHDMHACLESGLSAPHAEHVQMRVSADSHPDQDLSASSYAS